MCNITGNMATPANTIGMGAVDPLNTDGGLIQNLPFKKKTKHKLKSLVQYINESTKPLYAAIVLDEKSNKELLRLAKQQNFNATKYLCHHMTIAFGKDINKYESYLNQNENNVVEFKATKIGISDKALAVEVVTNVPSENKIKHITLAITGSGKPVDSNYIETWEKLPIEIQLSGKIQKVYR